MITLERLHRIFKPQFLYDLSETDIVPVDSGDWEFHQENGTNRLRIETRVYEAIGWSWLFEDIDTYPLDAPTHVYIVYDREAKKRKAFLVDTRKRE